MAKSGVGMRLVILFVLLVVGLAVVGFVLAGGAGAITLGVAGLNLFCSIMFFVLLLLIAFWVLGRR